MILHVYYGNSQSIEIFAGDELWKFHLDHNWIIEYKYEYMKPTKRKRLARLPMKLGYSVAKVNGKVSCA